MAGKGTASWGIQIEGATELKRALRVLQETDAPFLRAALEDAGHLLRSAAARRAPGSISQAVSFAGVKGGKNGNLRAVVQVKHPGGRSMEFGRVWYYRGFRGRQMRATGRKFRVATGQKARPYLGIIHANAAIGEVQDDVVRLLSDAFAREWERLADPGAS